MEETEQIKLRFIIEYQKEIPLNYFIRSTNAIKKFIQSCYEDANKRIENKEYKLNFRTSQPMITSVGNGCVWLDIVLAVASIAAPIIWDIIKEKKEKSKNDLSINNLIFMILPNSISVLPKSIACRKKPWNENDERLFTKEIIKEYVLNKSQESIDDFISKLPQQLHDYGHGSLRCKAQNTKQILNELPIRINNTLDCTPLSKYSKRHKQLVIEELKRNGILI